MPFELANASEVFQELMLVVLERQKDYALTYFDDILVFSNIGEST